MFAPRRRLGPPPLGPLRADTHLMARRTRRRPQLYGRPLIDDGYGGLAKDRDADAWIVGSCTGTGRGQSLKMFEIFWFPARNRSSHAATQSGVTCHPSQPVP